MTHSLTSKAFYSLLWAQFLSALGDNTTFIAAIALIKQGGGHVSIWESFLQSAFLIAYIVLAPYVGRFADGFPKNKVMLQGNALKLIGALAMICGFSPLISYAIIGIGAAVYGPAKYGILVEMLPSEKLVRANGFLEGSTIVAILLGVTIAGKIADISLPFLFWLSAMIYLGAGVANLFIPHTEPPSQFSLKKIVNYTKSYKAIFLMFLKKNAAQFSIMGTTTFWSVGTVLRLLLFVWVPYTFHNNSNTLPSVLMGALSIGIVLGAASAGLWISLTQVRRALIPGFLLSVVIVAIAFTHHLPLLFLWMVIAGFCGGMFVVPLNAMIQDVGHDTIGAGMALSIQNFCENSGMLSFTLLYSLLLHLSLPLPAMIVALAVIVFVIMCHLMRSCRVD